MISNELKNVKYLDLYYESELFYDLKYPQSC